jgi:hypothetical protein
MVSIGVHGALWKGNEREGMKAWVGTKKSRPAQVLGRTRGKTLKNYRSRYT